MLDTNLEVSDFIAAHLLSQAAPAMNEDGDCQYLTPEGEACAVGCLISRSVYDPGIEGTKLDNEILGMVEASIGFRPDIFMLGHLQTLHDTVRPSDWATELQTLRDNLSCV